MTTFLVLRWLHVIGATLLLGTGTGIAFFMVMAHRSRDPALIAHTASVVVIADYLFTATAAVLQPVTGILLVQHAGWQWTQGWILASIALYALTGAFWVPVVWMQTRMRDLARAAREDSGALSPAYFWLFRIWFVFGIPAFFAVLTIFWLMIAKPPLAMLRLPDSG